MDALDTFQDFVAQMPEALQPLAVALVAAVPFVEGEGAISIGLVGGINPIVAGLAAIAGNLLCVFVLVLIASRTRSAVVAHRARVAAREAVATDAPSAAVPVDEWRNRPSAEPGAGTRKQKFLHALDKYGVPGVSLLGPLLLPTMFTATMLAGVGVSRGRIMFWQTLAIVAWTVVVGGLVWSVLRVAFAA